MQKMFNDIELLEDKIENYYLKYGGLPVVRDENNNPVKYNYSDISNIVQEGEYKYKKVDYIESTGTQYIETDIYPTNKTNITLTMMIMSDNVASGWSAIIAPYNSTLSKDYFSVHYYSEQNRFGMRWFGKEYSGSGKNVGVMPKDRKFTMKFGQNIYNVDSTSDIYYSFADVSDTTSPYRLSFLKEGNITVKNGIFRIYEIVIENDDKVYDLIPVMDKDNVACLYDKLNGKFYYNAGTGEFKTNLDEVDEGGTVTYEPEIEKGDYQIIDLSAIGDITLNYGKEGYENPNSSDDVYIINEKTHNIYYVKGIEYEDGKLYHSKKVGENNSEDTIPPTKPEINIVDGDKINENNYQTNVILEFVSGKDNYSGVNKTTYSINGNTEQDINTLENHQYKINETGIYEVTLKTYDNNNNVSEITKTIYIGQIKQVEYLESTGTQYIDTGVKLNQNSKFELKAQTDQRGQHLVFGSRTSATSQNFACSITNMSTSDFYATIDFQNYTVNRLITDISIESITISGSNDFLSINDTKKDVTQYTDFQTPETAYIFNISGNPPASYAIGKIKLYYLKIWDNGILVRDYIPVIDENNVAYLYDKVEGKYYYNAGTGEFKTNLDEQ